MIINKQSNEKNIILPLSRLSSERRQDLSMQIELKHGKNQAFLLKKQSNEKALVLEINTIVKELKNEKSEDLLFPKLKNEQKQD
jgi:hypothetical protein